MKIKEETVKRTAFLANIALSDEETVRFCGQIGRILEYMEKLDRLDASDVEPSTHVSPACNVFRRDEPAASLSPENALSNAPDGHENYFKVPKIIDYET